MEFNMIRSTWFSRLMIVAVAFTLCGGPQIVAAQQTSPAPQTEAPAQEPMPANSDSQAQPVPQQDQSIGTTPESATPDPSKGPQTPGYSTSLPDAPSAAQQQNTQTP